MSLSHMKDIVVNPPRELDDDNDVVLSRKKRATEAGARFRDLLDGAVEGYRPVQQNGNIEKWQYVDALMEGFCFVQLADGQDGENGLVGTELGKKSVRTKLLKKLGDKLRKRDNLRNGRPAPANVAVDQGPAASSNTGIVARSLFDPIAVADAAERFENVTLNNHVSNTNFTGHNIHGDNVTNIHNYAREDPSKWDEIGDKIGDKIERQFEKIQSQLGAGFANVQGKLDSMTPHKSSFKAPSKTPKQGDGFTTPGPARKLDYADPPQPTPAQEPTVATSARQVSFASPTAPQPDFVSPTAAEFHGQSYFKDLADRVKGLEKIRVLETSSKSLQSMAQYFNLLQADPYLLCIIKNGNTPAGCIFYDVNESVGETLVNLENHTMTLLATALGLTHSMELKLGLEDEKKKKELYINMAVGPNNETDMSSILTFVCEIAIGGSKFINLVEISGPSCNTKYDLILDGTVMEQLVERFSKLQFQHLRLPHHHLVCMGKATGKKSFTFDQCEFAPDGENRLFHPQDGSEIIPMELEVTGIPHPKFWEDCKVAIRSGRLESLIFNDTRIDISAFLGLVDIQRELTDKGKDLGGQVDVHLIHPDPGFEYILKDARFTLPSKLFLPVVKEVASLNPNGTDYDTEAIRKAYKAYKADRNARKGKRHVLDRRRARKARENENENEE